jgi:hypothetical protein
MPTKMKMATPRTALTRILVGLEQELIDATDEEVDEAAKELGMDLRMRASAAFLGLRYPASAKFEDYFGFDPFQDAGKIRDDT